ncbi:MAG: methylated-DNA--[protein]-cysteine S-methyltransferase [Microthrixaceae bacterium]
MVRPGPHPLSFVLHPTPVGTMLIVAGPAGVRRADHGSSDDPAAHRRTLADLAARIGEPLTPATAGDLAIVAARQLDEYFAGTRTRFDVPLDLSGLPPFRREVLEAVTEIPFGHTVSYGELAEMAGRPAAHRAAASSCSHCPVSLLIPCHRVVHADGRVGGYGTRVDVKRWLLDFEQGRPERVNRRSSPARRARRG